MSSKISELLSVVSGTMNKDLEDFLKLSSNHISNDKKELALEMLQTLKSNKKAIKEDKEKAIPEMHSKKEVSYFKNQISKVLKRYFLLKEVESHKMLSNFFLLSFFSRNDLNKNYDWTLRDIDKQFSDGPIDEKYLLYKYLIYEIVITKERFDRKSNDNLQYMEHALDEFYTLSKIRLLHEKLSRKQILNTNPDKATIMLEEVVKTASPIVKISYLFYKMTENFQNDNFYLEAKRLFKDEKIQFSHAYQEEAIIRLQNYCIRKVNRNKVSYANEYLELFDELIELKQNFKDEPFNHLSFKNYIAMCLINKDIKRAKYFFNQHEKRLPIDKKDDCLQLCEAMIAFKEDKFDESQSILSKFTPAELSYRLAHHKLLIQINFLKFRKGTFRKDALITSINSEKSYIKKRKALTEGRKKIRLQFLEILMNLIHNRPVDLSENNPYLPLGDGIWFKELKEKKLI